MPHLRFQVVGAVQRTVLFLFGWFVVFLLLGGGIYWWMGTSLTNLAFFDSRSDQPLTVFEFVRAPATEQLQPAYARPIKQLFQEEGAQLYPGYSLQHVSRGTVADEWPQLISYQMPQGSALVEVMTSTAYRELQDAVQEFESLKLGSFQQMPENSPGALLVVLAQVRESTNLDPLSSILAMVPQHSVMIDDEPLNLQSEREWHRLLLVQFDNRDAAVAWLNDKDVALEWEILNSKLHHLAVMLYANN